MAHIHQFVPTIRIPTVEEARAALDAHKATRRAVGDPMDEAWQQKKAALETALHIAEGAAMNTWRDTATGEPCTPMPWAASSTSYTEECRRIAEERRKAKEAQKKPPHRPRIENPTKETLKKRRYMERKKAGLVGQPRELSQDPRAVRDRERKRKYRKEAA